MVFCCCYASYSSTNHKKITGSNDIALGHFCTIGYLVEAGVAKLVGNSKDSVEEIKLPKQFEFYKIRIYP